MLEKLQISDLVEKNSIFYPISPIKVEDVNIKKTVSKYSKMRKLPVDGNSFYSAIALAALEQYILGGRADKIKLMAYNLVDYSQSNLERQPKMDPNVTLCVLIHLSMLVDRKESEKALIILTKACLADKTFLKVVL